MTIPIIFALSALTLAAIALAFYFFGNKEKTERQRPRFNLERHHHNPIISPHPARTWDNCGTFNPAAVKDDEGKVHLLYRALGGDGISRIGHASSADGYGFDSRSDYPVFEPARGWGMPDENKAEGPKKYDPPPAEAGAAPRIRGRF